MLQVVNVREFVVDRYWIHPTNDFENPKHRHSQMSVGNPNVDRVKKKTRIVKYWLIMTDPSAKFSKTIHKKIKTATNKQISLFPVTKLRDVNTQAISADLYVLKD